MADDFDPDAPQTRRVAYLADALIAAAPSSAKHNAAERTKATNAWLEELEAHTSQLLGPFIERILAGSNPPPELKALLDEAAAPGAQFSSILQQVFIYGIVSSIAGQATVPFLQLVINDLWKVAVGEGIAVPLSAPNIATAVARGLELGQPPTTSVPAWAYDRAAESGVSPDDLNIMASIVGLPPALQELFELKRRGVIDDKEVETGLREGDFRDDWIARTIQLAHSWLTPDNFVRAAVQEQMSYSDARDWAYKTGLDTTTPIPVQTGRTAATPDNFGLAFSIAGRPPGPAELGRAANRGIIPWEGTGADALSFQQGIAESDVKTKWTGALRRLAEYMPPPREIGTLLEHGAITHEQAVSYWERQGVPTELANGYAYVASQQHIGQDKLLARGDIKTGYLDGIFSRQEAKAMLEQLGERDGVADEILSLLDFRREIQAINAMVKRVQNFYVSHRLSAGNAEASLTQLGVSEGHARQLLTIWDAVRTDPVRLPTPEQIAKAWKAGTITVDEATTELEHLGYEHRDAVIVLSSYSGTNITPLPPPGAGVTG
jgi:hypothetical protein